jgi:hypothetical protein
MIPVFAALLIFRKALLPRGFIGNKGQAKGAVFKSTA